MRYQPLYDRDKTVSAFKDECSQNKYLRRLRLIKTLVILALIGSLVGLGKSWVWGGSSAVLDLLIIWVLNSKIARKKQNIKEQYLI